MQCDNLMHICHEMITTMRLVSISFTSCNYHLLIVVVVVLTFEIYSLSNFQG